MNEKSNADSQLLKQLSEDVRAVRNYTRLLARTAILSSLKEVATTPERQQMWRLFDGTKSTEQIAKEIGASTRTIQYFVQEADSAGLLLEKRAYPKRIEDVIPSEWKSWKSKGQTSRTEPSVNDNAPVEEK